MSTGRYDDADLDDATLDGVVGGADSKASKSPDLAAGIDPSANVEAALAQMRAGQIGNIVNTAMTNVAAAMDAKGGKMAAAVDEKGGKGVPDAAGKAPSIEDVKPGAAAAKTDDATKAKADELAKMKSTFDDQLKSMQGVPKDFQDKLKVMISSVEQLIGKAGAPPADPTKTASKIEQARNDLTASVKASGAADPGKTGASPNVEAQKAMAAMTQQISGFAKQF